MQGVKFCNLGNEFSYDRAMTSAIIIASTQVPHGELVEPRTTNPITTNANQNLQIISNAINSPVVKTAF
ncbi:hypothetical protein SAMN05443582_103420 [Phyllobacterium sp. OV277]|nr:hypothetical protein SAMN05443582_103420 [Phyllobacterium sp. OV277]